MAELKTQPNKQSVFDFLKQIQPEQKQDDSFHLLDIMQKVTGLTPRMWGDSIIGFGEYYYKYPSGREGKWFLTGFSPRKQNLAIYLVGCYLEDNLEDLLCKLGKHKTGKSCLYISKLSDIDKSVLEDLVLRSIKNLKATYPEK